MSRPQRSHDPFRKGIVHPLEAGWPATRRLLMLRLCGGHSPQRTQHRASFHASASQSLTPLSPHCKACPRSHSHSADLTRSNALSLADPHTHENAAAAHQARADISRLHHIHQIASTRAHVSTSRATRTACKAGITHTTHTGTVEGDLCGPSKAKQPRLDQTALERRTPLGFQLSLLVCSSPS